ncbi:MAG: DNA polymerase III subunit gamma/tau [Bacteroidetes bacterium 4572_112]|nr:MAG: DNA polymerase III subunit gamma/tau [Bacteroidetes bacterium 4572_112]
MTFDTVIGQESITSTLKNSIKNNHLAQAFLFTGPRGVGKTTCARIFAKTINCENLNKETLEPCDKCESCVSFNQQNSFNIHELDAASNNSVDDIRRLVEQVRIPPQVGAYKVYIIDEVHMLSSAAFNAFLKTLEEPPSYAKFILATTEKHKIIPTILSRCQIYDFNRITVKDTANYLAYVAKSEGIEAEKSALLTMAQKADGAMRDALSIFDQIVSYTGKTITYKDTIDNLNILDVEYYFQMVDLFLRGDIPNTLTIYNDIISKGFDGLHFINGLASHLRNLLVSKDAQTISLFETSDDVKQKYQDQAKYCSIKFLIFAIDLCTKVDVNYKISSDKRLLIELNLMKMCKLEKPFEQEIVEALPEKKNSEISSKPTNTPKTQAITNTPIVKEQKTVETNIVAKTTESKTSPTVSEVNQPKNIVAEPAQEIPTIDNSAKITKKKRKTRGVSIKQGIKEVAAEEEINLNDALNESFDKVENEIKIEELEKAINNYRELILKERPAFAAAITFQNIELKPNNEILIKLTSETMNDIEFKYDMLLYLKNELKNKQISISTHIEQIKTSASKTSKDKYYDMVKINPKLDDLRKQLDLDFKA